MYNNIDKYLGENMDKYYLTNGNLAKNLIKFALPFLIACILQAMYGACDLFVVGQFATTADTTAVGIGSQVMQTITGIVIGLTTGSSVLIGQYFGGKKENKLAKAIKTTIVLFLIISIVLMFVIAGASPLLAKLMQTPHEAYQKTTWYIFICGVGTIFIMAFNVISAILRGLGDSKTPMIIIAISTVINIVLDLLFVIVLKWGTIGVALATVVAQTISVVCGIIIIKSKGFGINAQKSDYQYDKSDSKQIIKYGIPIAIQSAIVGLSFLIITALVNSMGYTADGLVESSAIATCEKVIIFLMLPTQALSSALAPIVAQNVGAGNEKRARMALRISIGLSLIFACVFVIVGEIIPKELNSIFTSNAEVANLAGQYLRTYIIDCILVCFIFCFNSYFSGKGKTGFVLMHSVIVTCLIRIPLFILFTRMNNPSFIWIGTAAPIASIVSIAMCYIYMHHLKKTSNH